MSRYHVVVIGAGPGGYVAAIRAAQLGFTTAVVERERLGGICLNWGCIPTKSLLESAHRLEDMRRAAEFGLHAADVRADFSAVIARSRRIADEMAKGVEFLLKKNKITVVPGTARFLDAYHLEVKAADGSTQTIESDRFIIATGARARALPGIPIDGEKVIEYRKAMTLTAAPARLCVIGAGAIGIEFSDFYAALGSQVTILEYLPQILPQEDEEVAKLLLRSLQKRGLQIHTGVRVESATVDGANVRVTWSDASGTKATGDFDVVLSAAGVAANTENLGLEQLGVRMVKDRVDVNDHYQTSVPNIYAIGDCIPGPALAHVASLEGVRAAEAMKYGASHSTNVHYERVNYDLIPGCTYCHPEVASIGLTEKQAVERGLNIQIGRFPFTASGRARAAGDTHGFIKVIIDAKLGEVLGAHIIGPGATELISEITLGASAELTAENFARTIHAHPTLSEGVMEAVAAALGEAINI